MEDVEDMNRKNSELSKAFDECLEMWEILSGLEDMEVNYTRHKITSILLKNLILREVMGIRTEDGYKVDYNSGCPFCERYICLAGCTGCPIYSEVKNRTESDKSFLCFETPYRLWDVEMDKGIHVQAYAQEFFEYLLKLRVSTLGE